MLPIFNYEKTESTIHVTEITKTGILLTVIRTFIFIRIYENAIHIDSYHKTNLQTRMFSCGSGGNHVVRHITRLNFQKYNFLLNYHLF